MGEDYSNLQKSLQQQSQFKTPLKPSGPKSNTGCIFLVAGLILFLSVGLTVFFLRTPILNILSEKTASKKNDNGKNSSVSSSLKGYLMDAIIIPDKNDFGKLWIMSSEYKKSEFRVYTFIYDPIDEKILNSFESDYEKSYPQIHLFYLDNEVLKITGDASGVEPGISTFNAQTGDLILNNDTYLKQFPDIKSGISKIYVNNNPLRADIETKDGLKFTIDFVNKKLYKNYSDFRNSFKNDNTKVKIFALGNQKSGEDARKKLFLVSGTKANLWDADIPESYFTDKSTLKFFKNAEATLLIEDKVFLEGVMLYKDDECCVIFHQSQVGNNAERILSCINIKGNVMWTASTENELFSKLRATDKEATSSMFFMKSNVHVLKEGNLILLKVDRLGIIGFDYEAGKKIFEIKLSS